MSRSNPDIFTNPCTRWLEWDGSNGNLRYYDKSVKENITIDLPFTFLFLDQMSKVAGWSDAAESNIYSNEVKNTNNEVLTVRTSGSNVIAQGKYSEIRDTIKAKGGYYLASIYIAYKDESDSLRIGNIGFKGAALSSWMDFMKTVGPKIYDKAVKIDGYEEGKKGYITYRMPTFKLIDIAPETDKEAIELDQVLQDYFKSKPDYIDDKPEEQPPVTEERPMYDDSDFPADDFENNLPF